MPSAQSLVNKKGSYYLCGDIHGNTDFFGNLIAAGSSKSGKF
jgi:hypothetical protein